MSAPENLPKKAAAIDYKKHKRFEAVLSQIISAGVSAFLTHKANVKGDTKLGIDEKVYCQEAVWTNEKNGIITMLKRHESFDGCVFPKGYASVLQAVDRLLEQRKHLYTSGMEQAEPAAAGTEETKDERPLTELKQAIVEVAELKAEAARITAENQSGKMRKDAYYAKGAEELQESAASPAARRAPARRVRPSTQTSSPSG